MLLRPGNEIVCMRMCACVCVHARVCMCVYGINWSTEKNINPKFLTSGKMICGHRLPFGFYSIEKTRSLRIFIPLEGEVSFFFVFVWACILKGNSAFSCIEQESKTDSWSFRLYTLWKIREGRKMRDSFWPFLLLWINMHAQHSAIFKACTS